MSHANWKITKTVTQKIASQESSSKAMDSSYESNQLSLFFLSLTSGPLTTCRCPIFRETRKMRRTLSVYQFLIALFSCANLVEIASSKPISDFISRSPTSALSSNSA